MQKRAKIKQVRLINYGICQPTGTQDSIYTEDSPSGVFHYSDGISFLQTTDVIAIEKGLHFGISYRIHGDSSDKSLTQFFCRILHPALTNPLTKLTYHKTVELKSNHLNADNFDNFCFDYSWEMSPGKWIFQIVQHKKILLEKAFTLIV